MKNRWRKMFSKIENNRRALASRSDRLTQAAQMATLQEHRRALLESPRNTDERRLLKYGYRVYSQGDEDGILHEIFRRIGEGRRTFLEIGVGTGVENNTLFLLIQGWRGVWIEGSQRHVAAAKKNLEEAIAAGLWASNSILSPRPTLVRRFETSRPADVDLLSIDLDGNDLLRP
jgi:hypothetical protein